MGTETKSRGQEAFGGVIMECRLQDSVAVETLLACDGPVAVMGADGQVIRGNSRATDLCALVSRDDAVGAGAMLRDVVRDSLSLQGPLSRVLQIPRGSVLTTLEVTCLPMADRTHALILARDTSLDVTLRCALTDSRSRYKDFVELSSDFTWETDEDGQFAFVSPSGALGYGAGDLVGTEPARLLDSSEGRAGGAVFVTRRRVLDVELWARNRDQRLVCLTTSAMPLLDETGRWVGARGICRDITDQRERERALSRARNRERVRAHVVRTFRDELNLENMLDVAAEALARGVGASACHILRRPSLDKAGPQGGPRRFDTPARDLVMGGHFGSAGDATRLRGVLETMEPGSPPWDARVGDQIILLTVSSHRQAVNGAVVLWRKADRGGWSEDDRLLIQDVANQVGIANEQMARHDTIIAMARTDSLTGLLNRRAFFEDIGRRHQRLERSDRKAALMYLDLDNFKHVNDAHGHFRGDEALMCVGEMLATHTRPTDLVARLGGDEFAVWLEDADESVANRKARALLEAGGALRGFSGSTDRPLTLSIGVAIVDPDRPEDLKALTTRADSAMYCAKRAGKGCLRMAMPPGCGLDGGDLPPPIQHQTLSPKETRRGVP